MSPFSLRTKVPTLTECIVSWPETGRTPIQALGEYRDESLASRVLEARRGSPAGWVPGDRIRPGSGQNYPTRTLDWSSIQWRR
jgi:hypothetical protein